MPQNTPLHLLSKNVDLFVSGYCPFMRQHCGAAREGLHLVELLFLAVDVTQLSDQCGENPVARLQPTTGVMSQIFTMRSVPQVTISPLATSMDMWEMLCFPS